MIPQSSHGVGRGQEGKIYLLSSQKQKSYIHCSGVWGTNTLVLIIGCRPFVRLGSGTVRKGMSKYLRASHDHPAGVQVGYGATGTDPGKLPRPEKRDMTGRIGHGLVGKKGKSGMKTPIAMGIRRDAMEKADPAYARALRDAEAYRKIRQREFFVSFGYVSAGVSAMLCTAALFLATSRYLANRTVAETGILNEKGGFDVANLKQLAHIKSLADAGRNHELAAWELASREAASGKAALAGSMTPWLEQAPVNKGGRTSKSTELARMAPPPPMTIHDWEEEEVAIGHGEAESTEEPLQEPE